MYDQETAILVIHGSSICTLSFSYPDSVPHMTTPEQMEKNILTLLQYLVRFPFSTSDKHVV